MSHTVKIKAQFKIENLSSFRRALEHFGWKLKENSKARTYYSDPARDTIYDMVAVNPATGDAYDLGVKLNHETGEIEILGDFFGGSVSRTLGAELKHLKKEYSCCVIEDQLAYKGYTPIRQEQNNGEIDIIAE